MGLPTAPMIHITETGLLYLRRSSRGSEPRPRLLRS